MELTPPGSRTITVVLARTQLHSVQAIKTDKVGNFLELDTDKYEPPSRHNKKGKKKGSNQKYKKGPDEKGKFKTFRILFHEQSPNKNDNEEQDLDSSDGDFGVIKKYMNVEEEGLISLHFRHFGLDQSRTRVRANVNKIDSFIKKRRQKLLVKENATLPWQGILCLIFGVVGLLLTLLIGQFWDETPKRQGGPGARRTGPSTTISNNRRTGVGSSSSSSTKPSFFYDSGRPSKYPPGYQKKY